MKNLLIMSILITILYPLTACDSTPKGNFNIESRKITIHSQPEGAVVYQLHPFGQPATKLGTTPIIDQPITVITDISFKNMPYTQTQEFVKYSGANVKINIKKDGYIDHSSFLATKHNQTTDHNITLQKNQ